MEPAGEFGPAYATALSVLMLGAGAAVQPLVRKVPALASRAGLVAGLSVIGAGVLTAIVTVVLMDLVWGLFGAIVLGMGMGVSVVAGLSCVQRISPPAQLARATGVFYALAYAGFLLPTALSAAPAAVSPALCLAAVLVPLGITVLVVVLWSQQP